METLTPIKQLSGNTNNLEEMASDAMFLHAFGARTAERVAA